MKPKYLKLTKAMLKGNYSVKVKKNKSMPACMQCLPPRSLDGHPELYGVLVHSRIDVEEGMLYVINEDHYFS